jgi:hypothetical protein
MKKFLNKKLPHPLNCYVRVIQVKILFFRYYYNLKEEFEIYFKYCKSLKFEERPDYVWIRRLFKDLFYKCDYQWDLIFDWALVYYLHTYLINLRCQRKKIKNNSLLYKINELFSLYIYKFL